MRKKLTRVQYRRKKQMKRICVFSGLLLLLVTGICILWSGTNIVEFLDHLVHPTPKVVSGYYESLNIKKMLLTPNEYSRPEKKLKHINGVVIHYTANPGTDAKQNRNYFDGLKEGKMYENGNYIYSSSNFIVGLKGDIIQCVPTDEVAYASNSRNEDTLSIEVCHPDETGEFTKKSYKALVKLTAYICSKYNLQKDDIIRHYDVTGKMCPKYYVEHEDEWKQFKEDVFEEINNNAQKK